MNPDSPGYLDPRRSFTRAEVYRAWELQGRVCKLCRRAIPVDLMHGDHISPWIEGGRTELTNLQALAAGEYYFETGNLAHTAQNKTNLPLRLVIVEILPKDWTAPALIAPEATMSRPVVLEAD